MADGDDKLPRSAVIHGTSGCFHAWMAFGSSREPVVISQHPVFNGAITPLRREFSLPLWESENPYTQSETRKGLSSPNRPLPRLWPQVSAPEIQRFEKHSKILLRKSAPPAESEPGYTGREERRQDRHPASLSRSRMGA